LRMRFCPITARPIRPMSPCASIGTCYQKTPFLPIGKREGRII